MQQIKVHGYLMRVLVAADMLGAAVLGCPNDITISSESGLYKSSSPWAGALYKILDAIQPDHCEKSIVNDEKRASDAEIDLHQ